MHEHQRREAILALLDERRMVTAAELVGRLGVSIATVRRDIRRLDALRLIERIPAGAKRAEQAYRALLPEPANDPAAAAKRAIGRAAAALCADGEAIMVSSGSTTDHLIRHLADRQLQVFTNSPQAAAFLVAASRNQVVVAGGEVYRKRNLILGLDDDPPRRYRASTLFMGALGITVQGVTETDSAVVRAERQLIACVDRVVVLADSTKFQPRGNLITCPLAEIATVVTDQGVTPEAVAMLQRAGCTVMIAPEDCRAAALPAGAQKG